jgi:ABC-type Co2+ transport system permease subunit
MTTLGANTCIIALPALLAGGIYRWGSRTGRVGRACLLGLGLGLAALALAVSGSYLTGHDVPWLLAIPAAVVLGLMAAGIGWARGLSSIWPAGLVAGMGGVLGAAALNALVLTFGTDAPFARLAGLLFASHLPLAIVEGIVVASAIGFLRSVRPDLIDDPQVIDAAQPAG